MTDKNATRKIDLTAEQVVKVLNCALEREALKKSGSKGMARTVASSYFYDEKMLKLRDRIYEIPDSQIEVANSSGEYTPMSSVRQPLTEQASTQAPTVAAQPIPAKPTIIPQAKAETMVRQELKAEPQTKFTEQPTPSKPFTDTDPTDFWASFAQIYSKPQQ